MPDDDRVEHLLLLVGSNPLPNAVAAKVLAKPHATVTLIYSTTLGRRGNPVEQRLKLWLEKQHYKTALRSIDDESNVQQIKAVILAAVQGIQAKDRIAFNYTGGTKAMSVHAHHRLRKWADEQGRSVSMSYLDARKLKLVFDDGKSLDIGDTPIALDEILDLHGRSKKSDRQTLHLPKTAGQLAHVYAQKNARLAWENWLITGLYPDAKKWDKRAGEAVRCSKDAEVILAALFPQKWKSKTALEGVELPWPQGPELTAVIETIRQETQTDSTFNLGVASQNGQFGEPEKLCQWLDGEWLEHWVFQSLQACADLGVHGLGMGLNLPDTEDKAEFQFDVAGVRGYQLFALSCTVSTSRQLCKSKLIEAYLRARQLGGDEARTALVCAYQDPKKLEKETQRDIDTDGRIRVFGEADLPNLPGLIRDWICQQSRIA